MNDAPITSTAGPSTSLHEDITLAPELISSGSTASARQQDNRKLFNRGRHAFLTDLVRQLDILVYAELSIIYYMDNSFLSLLTRSLQHFTLLTPPPRSLPPPPLAPSHHFILLTTFLLNTLCALTHALAAPPSASEITRGYLHGSVAIDFVGFLGPSSRVHLVLLDVLVWVLQVVCLEAVAVQKRARKVAGRGGEGVGALLAGSGLGMVGVTGAATLGDLYAGVRMAREELDMDDEVEPVQTVEDEERGEMAGEARGGDVELRELNTSGVARASAVGSHNRGDDGNEESGEASGLLGEVGERRDQSTLRDADVPRRRDAHLFDAFNSGEVVVADINPIRFVRKHYSEMMRRDDDPEATVDRRQRLISAIARRHRDRYLRELERLSS